MALSVSHCAIAEDDRKPAWREKKNLMAWHPNLRLATLCALLAQGWLVLPVYSKLNSFRFQLYDQLLLWAGELWSSLMSLSWWADDVSLSVHQCFPVGWYVNVEHVTEWAIAELFLVQCHDIGIINSWIHRSRFAWAGCQLLFKWMDLQEYTYLVLPVA